MIQDQEREEVIHLRPHHLLCMRYFRGKGYSPEFVRNMSDIIDRLRRDPNARIEVIEGADDLCAACPHLDADRVCSRQELVGGYDGRTAEAFGLEEGEHSFGAVCSVMEQTLDSRVLAGVCPDCSWSEICHNMEKMHEHERTSP